MKNRVFIITFFCFNMLVFSKSKKDLAENPLIKSVVFSGGTFDSQFPIIKLNQRLFLSFDDISGEENFYYYRIIHCNFDWNESKLLKSEYLDGNDNNLIDNIDY